MKRLSSFIFLGLFLGCVEQFDQPQAALPKENTQRPNVQPVDPSPSDEEKVPSDKQIEPEVQAVSAKDVAKVAVPSLFTIMAVVGGYIFRGEIQAGFGALKAWVSAPTTNKPNNTPKNPKHWESFQPGSKFDIKDVEMLQGKIESKEITAANILNYMVCAPDDKEFYCRPIFSMMADLDASVLESIILAKEFPINAPVPSQIIIKTDGSSQTIEENTYFIFSAARNPTLLSHMISRQEKQKNVDFKDVKDKDSKSFLEVLINQGLGAEPMIYLKAIQMALKDPKVDSASKKTTATGELMWELFVEKLKQVENYWSTTRFEENPELQKALEAIGDLFKNLQ